MNLMKLNMDFNSLSLQSVVGTPQGQGHTAIQGGQFHHTYVHTVNSLMFAEMNTTLLLDQTIEPDEPCSSQL